MLVDNIGTIMHANSKFDCYPTWLSIMSERREKREPVAEISYRQMILKTAQILADKNLSRKCSILSFCLPPDIRQALGFVAFRFVCPPISDKL